MKTGEKLLIDANALKRKFDEREADDVELYGCVIAECFPADDAKEIVDQMPTVDAVEVVRCKDCNHYRSTNDGGLRYCGYTMMGRVTKADDFCSNG